MKDELWGINVPGPVYDSARTCEHGETAPSACYHLFYRQTTLLYYRVLELSTVEQTTKVDEARVARVAKRGCFVTLVAAVFNLRRT